MNRQLHDLMMAQYATPKVSGDGLVSWNGGVKCVIPSVKLYGAANQGTMSGSNMLNPALYEFESGYTKNGVTLTINDDGSITASGTPTIKSGRIMMLYLGEYIDVLKNGETYIENGCWFVVKKSDGTQTWPGTVTVDTDTMVSIRPYFEIYVDDYSNGMTRYIAINHGTTHLPWERYCGGIPAPNPSYPIMPVCNDGVFKATIPDGAWDGGQATSPELWAIPGTDIRDEWDAQTGWGVRRCAVIDSYAGEQITTPYISSTGELSEGAMVVYGIPDTPFYTAPARLTQPNGPGQIIQVSGSVPDCPIEANYLTHS